MRPYWGLLECTGSVGVRVNSLSIAKSWVSTTNTSEHTQWLCQLEEGRGTELAWMQAEISASIWLRMERASRSVSVKAGRAGASGEGAEEMWMSVSEGQGMADVLTAGAVGETWGQLSMEVGLPGCGSSWGSQLCPSGDFWQCLHCHNFLIVTTIFF